MLELRFRKHFQVTIVRSVAIYGALIMCQACLNAFLDTLRFGLTGSCPKPRGGGGGEGRVQTQPGLLPETLLPAARLPTPRSW